MEFKLTSNSWDHKEIEAIKKVIKHDHFTYGKYVKEFEIKFAKYFNKKYSIMVNSGSSANLISIASLFYKKKNPLKPGDEVIVPAISWSTSYYPLMQYGLSLKFVDVDLETINCNIENIQKAITSKTKLILGVNILGNPLELVKLNKICKKNNIYLMEDNCESMGAKIDNKYAGTFGIINTFSTFYSHHISTIEGGIVLTDDFELYNLCLSLRSHGWTRDLDNKFILKKKQKKYENYLFVLPGYNVRPTNINGAIGIEQLKKLKNFIKIRRHNMKIFNNLFKDSKYFIIQKENGQSSSFAFTFIIKREYKNLKSKIYKILKKNKIEFRLITGGCFIKHPVAKYSKYKIYKNLNNANYIHENGFFIGNHPKNLEKELKFLHKVLSKI